MSAQYYFLYFSILLNILEFSENSRKKEQSLEITSECSQIKDDLYLLLFYNGYVLLFFILRVGRKGKQYKHSMFLKKQEMEGFGP